MSAILGAEAFVIIVLTMLSGADLPPPPGFAWVVLGAAVIGLLVWRGLRRLLMMAEGLGRTRSIGLAAAAGAGVMAVVVIVLALVSPGEPSVPTSTVSTLMALLLLGCVLGALGGAVVAAIGLAAQRADGGRRAVVLLVLPALAMLLVPVAVLGVR